VALHNTTTGRLNLVAGDEWHGSTSDVALSSLSTDGGSYGSRLWLTLLLLPGTAPAHSTGTRFLGGFARGSYNTSDQTVTLIRPGVKDGDDIIIGYRSRTAPAALSGWTQIGSVDSGGSEPVHPLTIYRRTVTDASTEPVTVTLSQAASGTGLQSAAVVAVRPNDPMTVDCYMSAFGAGAGGTIVAPGVSGAPAGRVLRIFGSLSNVVPSLDTGDLSAQMRVASNDYQHITVARGIHAAAGDLATSTLTLSSSKAQRSAATLVLSLAPPGVGTLATARAEARANPVAGATSAAPGVGALAAARAVARANAVVGVSTQLPYAITATIRAVHALSATTRAEHGLGATTAPEHAMGATLMPEL
jgi:hypothetical protein